MCGGVESMWAGEEGFQGMKLYHFISGSMNNCKFSLPQRNWALQKLPSTKPLWAALESSLSPILVSLKKPPLYFTNCGSITSPHLVPTDTDVSLGIADILHWGGIWQSSPSFSLATRVPRGRGAGLCDEVAPRRPRPGKEAVAGQKSSAVLSVWVLLSLLPVFAWDAAGTGTGMQDKEGKGGGSEGPDGWSWCSFPKSSPENTERSVASWLKCYVLSLIPPWSYKMLDMAHFVWLSFSLDAAFSGIYMVLSYKTAFWKQLSLPCLPFCTPPHPSGTYSQHSLAHLPPHPILRGPQQQAVLHWFSHLSDALHHAVLSKEMLTFLINFIQASFLA